MGCCAAVVAERRPLGMRGAPTASRPPPFERCLQGARVKEMSSAPSVLCSVSVPNVSSSPSPPPPFQPFFWISQGVCVQEMPWPRSIPM